MLGTSISAIPSSLDEAGRSWRQSAPRTASRRRLERPNRLLKQACPILMDDRDFLWHTSTLYGFWEKRSLRWHAAIFGVLKGTNGEGRVVHSGEKHHHCHSPSSRFNTSAGHGVFTARSGPQDHILQATSSWWVKLMCMEHQDAMTSSSEVSCRIQHRSI